MFVLTLEHLAEEEWVEELHGAVERRCNQANITQVPDRCDCDMFVRFRLFLNRLLLFLPVRSMKFAGMITLRVVEVLDRSVSLDGLDGVFAILSDLIEVKSPIEQLLLSLLCHLSFLVDFDVGKPPLRRLFVRLVLG